MLTRIYLFYTPYQFVGNKPVISINLDGAEDLIVTNYLFKLDGTRAKLNSTVDLRNGDWVGESQREGYFFEGKKDKFGNYAYYLDGRVMARQVQVFWQYVKIMPNILKHLIMHVI